MKTKKTLLVALTVMCAMAISSSFVACGSDDDDGVKTFSYTIDFGSYTYIGNLNLESLDAPQVWYSSLINAYTSALGISTTVFKKTGNQAECDQQVYDACKRAEETVKTLRGGSTTVSVANTTVGKIVYSYQVQP